MNLRELRDLARVKLDDAVEPYLWSDEFLNGAINRAQDEAILRIGGIGDDYTPRVTTSIATMGSNTVVLDPSVLKVEDVYIRGAKLIPTSEVELDLMNPLWREDVGVPSRYILGTGLFTVYPVPDADYVLSFNVRRGAIASLSKDSSIPEVPTTLQPRLLHWVLYEAYQLPDADTNNPKAAETHHEAFEGVFGKQPSAKFLNAWSKYPARMSALMRRL
jgi:hypothetical protein